MSWDHYLDLQVFRNQLYERKEKISAFGRKKKYVANTCGAFHSLVHSIVFIFSLISSVQPLFSLWYHSGSGYLNLSCCDTRKRTDALLYFFLASILPLSQAQIAYWCLRTEEASTSAVL